MITLKITVFILSLSILNVIKEGFSVYSAYKNERKYEASPVRNVLTMASLSYIITLIACGL